MEKKLLFWVLCSILLICIDQLTKYFFYDLWVWSEKIFLEPLLNDWISWWMSMPIIIILFVSVVCICLFIFLFLRGYLGSLEFSLLFAWTIWNLIDRIFLWWVRDFISIWSFPVFNFADIFLTCGVVRICVKEIFHLQKKGKSLP